MIYLASCVLAFLSLVSAQVLGDPDTVGRFFNPANSTAIPISDFSRNVVWTIGEIQQIQWTTVFREYTIALWQQNLGKGSASRGPAIFQTTNGALAQFSWIVDDFGFDLKESNVFFLWLHDGPYAQNGNTSVLSTTSRYFNISDAPFRPSASSGTSTQTSLTSSQTSGAAKGGSTSTSSTISASANPNSAQSTTSSAITIETNSTNNTNNNNSSGSSQLGIGIGVGIGGVIIVLAGVFVFWYIRRRAKARSQNGGEKDLAPQNQNPVEMDSAFYRPEPQKQDSAETGNAFYRPDLWKQNPAEMESAYYKPAAELYVSDHRRKTLAELM